MKKALAIFLLSIISLVASAAVSATDFDFVWDKAPIKLSKGESVTTNLTFSLPDGCYLYKDETDLEFLTLEGVLIEEVSYPKGAGIADPRGGPPALVYHSGEEIAVQMKIPEVFEDGVYRVSALLHYQGCTRELCLPAAVKAIEWTLYVGDTGNAVETAGGLRGIKRELTRWYSLLKNGSGSILNINLKWLYIIAFLGGIISSFTPCILPLIPVTMLIIGVRPDGKWKRNLGLSLLLVLGMSATFALLGVIAAGMGRSLSFVFQSPLFVVFVVIFFFFMGLSLLGVYTMDLPQGLRNFLSRIGGGGARGAFFSGASMGILATPCIGPILGALLLYAATSERVGISFTLLMVYGLGLGVIIILIGTWYGTLAAKLKKARLKWAKKFIGLLMIIAALYYLNSLVPFTDLVLGKAREPIDWRQPKVALMAPSGERPEMIFFTAKWCPPCMFLKAFVLNKPEIVEMSESFINVKVDMTYATHENQFLARKYDVHGWPTIIFVSPGGKVYDDLTIFGGYLSEGELLDYMEETLSRSEVEGGS